jgi:hypothetical protein
MRGLRVIEVRKLAALDMAWLGTRLVLAEYALGVVLPAALGTLSLRSGAARHAELYQWPVLGGIWLLTIAANYIPLFLYAVALARTGTAREEAQAELPHVRRYGLQQAMILVPLLVLALSVAQERGRWKARSPE